jgi:hypothetical protein
MREHGMQLRFDSGMLEYVRQGQTKSQAFEIQKAKKRGEVQFEEVKRVSERCIEKNHESSSGFVENVTGSVVETLHPSTDKELGSELTKKADVTCYSIDTYKVSAQEKHSNVDPRDLQEKDLGIMVEQSKTINVAQKPQLFEGSNKFFPSFTERPGKCRLLKYWFHANSGQSLRSFSRQVPFVFRPAVKFQIQNKIKGGHFKKICQKLLDKPLKEDLLTIIWKAFAKVRKKAEKRKSQNGKVKFKRQIGGQVLAKHQPVSNARKANTKSKEKAESRKSRKRKVKFKW